jgi:alpha 1,3-glucosidase
MKHDPFTLHIALDISGNAHGERDCLVWVRCKWVRTAYDPKNEFACSVGNVSGEAGCSGLGKKPVSIVLDDRRELEPHGRVLFVKDPAVHVVHDWAVIVKSE